MTTLNGTSRAGRRLLLCHGGIAAQSTLRHVRLTAEKEKTMKIQQAAKLLLLGLTATACTLALAQGRPDLGKREYDTNCAVCHGLDAKDAFHALTLGAGSVA